MTTNGTEFISPSTKETDISYIHPNTLPTLKSSSQDATPSSFIHTTMGDEKVHNHSRDLDHSSRNYWQWAKSDFLPSQSFKDWPSYSSALLSIPSRLLDRLSSRSSAALELRDLRARSLNPMKRCLTWWDLTWFGFGSIIGAGIFVLTGHEAHYHAGPAIVLSYVASGISAMLSVFCYTEFAVEIPAAGGSFAYLRVELGDFVAFVVAANLLLECAVGSAAVARAWTSYLAALLGRPARSLRIRVGGLAEGFDELDPIAVGVLLATGAIAAVSTKRTSCLNWVASVVHAVIIVFVIVAAFTRADTRNLRPFAPYGAKGVFRAAAVVYFAYGGFDNVATMAEETRNPNRDIPIGLLGSMSVITVIYCLMALALSLMQRYTDIDPDAAFSVAFRSAGIEWAQYVVALGALKGMTTVLLVGTLGSARYITHIARTHIIPPLLALVHPTTGTPVYATAFITICSATLGFFSSLDVLANLLSISSLFVYMMMSVALLVRRYYGPGVTTVPELSRLVAFILLIVSSAMATSAYWGLQPGGWVGYVVTLPTWVAATAGLAVVLPQRRRPEVWGVPLVPWLPSLSIATNLFLMGSLGHQSFLRFGICSAAMLVYYLLVGLHSTYDAAHGKGEGTGKEEEGGGEKEGGGMGDGGASGGCA